MKDKIVKRLNREIEFFEEAQLSDKLKVDEKYHIGFVNGVDYAMEYIIKLYEEKESEK